MMRQYHRLDADDPELNAARAEYDKVIKDWRRARMGGGSDRGLPSGGGLVFERRGVE